MNATSPADPDRPDTPRDRVAEDTAASTRWLLALGALAMATSLLLGLVSSPWRWAAAGVLYLGGIAVLARAALTHRVRLQAARPGDLLVVTGFMVLWVLLVPAGMLAGETTFWLVGGGAVLALSVVGAVVLRLRSRR